MVIIFSLLENDSQLELVGKYLTKFDIPHRTINPHLLQKEKVVLFHKNGEVKLLINGEQIDPKIFFMSTQWRTENIIQIPKGCIYPQVFRSRVSQFLQDIRFAFEDRIWMPGKIEALERAESKVRMFSCAEEVGLRIPVFTCNAFRLDLPKIKSPIYRKNLGYPFMVSLNKRKGIEVGVTTTNTTYTSLLRNNSNWSPWQWQEMIPASKQIRCCIVGNKVWSASWTPQDIGMDFRFVNEVQNQNILWETYDLEPSKKQKLHTLCQKLNIKWCAPEFLIHKETNELVLIDLNPCGDWQGFFKDSINEQIAEEIASKISRAHNL